MAVSSSPGDGEEGVRCGPVEWCCRVVAAHPGTPASSDPGPQPHSHTLTTQSVLSQLAACSICIESTVRCFFFFFPVRDLKENNNSLHVLVTVFPLNGFPFYMCYSLKKSPVPVNRSRFCILSLPFNDGCCVVVALFSVLHVLFTKPGIFFFLNE